MRDSLAQLFVHIVWSTWDRQPLLTPELREAIYGCIRAECETMGTSVIALGGTEDHVHLFVELPPVLAVADLVKQVKGSSSHLMNHVLQPEGCFKWQGGYAVFSVSRSAGPDVRTYIRNQDIHHREGTVNRFAEMD